MSKTWNEQAAELDPKLLDHNWAHLLRRQLRNVQRETFEELKASGQLRGYLIVTVADALKDLEARLAVGNDPQIAESEVLRDMLPINPEEEYQAEPWEEEGAQADEQAAAEKLLGESSAS